jgi:hypothetical protein
MFAISILGRNLQVWHLLSERATEGWCCRHVRLGHGKNGHDGLPSGF